MTEKEVEVEAGPDEDLKQELMLKEAALLICQIKFLQLLFTMW